VVCHSKEEILQTGKWEMDELENDMEMWSDEMWQIWETGSGIIHVGDVRCEYWLCSGSNTVWLRPEKKDSFIVYSNMKRDDPLYVNGTEQFRAMVEAVRVIRNIVNAKRTVYDLNFRPITAVSG